MSTAAAALRAAINAALNADASVATLLGGAKVYDEAPKSVVFPYVTMGDARTTEIAVAEAPTVEHQLTLHAWSRQGGHREAHLIAGAIIQALDDAPLTLSGNRLVNLRLALADVRRESDGRTYHALIRFRAVTEPAI
jgi:hypothetical protein